VRFVADSHIPANVAFEPEGEWKLLSHGQDVNTEEHVSVQATFSANNMVFGGYSGKYAVEGEKITLTLDGVEYRGDCAIGYDADQDAFVSTFTAMSVDGQTLWGVRATGQA
jgi:arabinan endo-1,5-alpha-L-arabinosidase